MSTLSKGGQMPGAGSELKIPMFGQGDVSALLYTFTGNVGNFILVAFTLISVLGWSPELVFGRVVPGIAVGLFIQGFYYSWMAWRLAKKEGRTDVTALPSGLSSPAVFVFLFGVVMPLQLSLEATGLSGEALYQTAFYGAVAACFVGGIVEALGGLISPYLRKWMPRVAMLATVAGVALVWMGTKGFFSVFHQPVLALPVLMIAILGLIGGYKIKKIDPIFLSFILGLILALILGISQFTTQGFGFNPPVPSVNSIVMGFALIVPYLTAIIPVEIYNFLETMDNVEAAHAAGDAYNVAEAQISNGVATMVSAVFGGIIPNTVWIGHSGLKRNKAGIGYSWLSGVLFMGFAMIGGFEFLYDLIPISIVGIVYIWCTLTMVGQTFMDIPRRHVAAAVIALIPQVADFVFAQINGALQAVGVFEVTPEVENALISSGVLWEGLPALKYGSILTSMLWAAMLAFIIDRQLIRAAVVAAGSGVLSFFGFMHAPTIGINMAPGIMIGYFAMAVIFIAYHYLSKTKLIDLARRFDYV